MTNLRKAFLVVDGKRNSYSTPWPCITAGDHFMIMNPDSTYHTYKGNNVYVADEDAFLPTEFNVWTVSARDELSYPYTGD